MTSVENCGLHAAGREYVSYKKSDPGKSLVYNTISTPAVRGEDSFCIIISKGEDKPRNMIRLHVEPVY